MPRPKKPAEVRQRAKDGHREGDVGLVVVPLEQPLLQPDPPKQWLARSKEQWAAFWLSPLAQLVLPVDVPAVERLFSAYDRLARAEAVYRKQPIVEGSMGQQVLSPMAGEMHALAKEITTLEDRLGVTPLARLKLGVKFGEARQALGDAWDVSDELDVADDPRLRAVDVDVAEGGG